MFEGDGWMWLRLWLCISCLGAMATNVASPWKNGAVLCSLNVSKSVHCWGDASSGAYLDSWGVVSTNVSQLVSSEASMAALYMDGTVSSWGVVSAVAAPPTDLVNVTALASTASAFAAVYFDANGDSHVAAWGGAESGGVLSADEPVSGVVSLLGNAAAFCAVLSDGSVRTWGAVSAGGTAPASVAEADGGSGGGVVSVSATAGAFAALLEDGTVVAWGRDKSGGFAPPSLAVAAGAGLGVEVATSPVVAIFATLDAFAALHLDGSVSSWGNVTAGGNATFAPTGPSAAMGGGGGARVVMDIVSCDIGFAAIYNDSSVTVDSFFSLYTA